MPVPNSNPGSAHGAGSLPHNGARRDRGSGAGRLRERASNHEVRCGPGHAWEHLGLFQSLLEVSIQDRAGAGDRTLELALGEADRLRSLRVASGLPCRTTGDVSPPTASRVPVLAFHPTPGNLEALRLARHALVAGPQPPCGSDLDALAVLEAIGRELLAQGFARTHLDAGVPSDGRRGAEPSGGP